MERKLFTALQGEYAEKLNDTLSKQGFRRSQNVLYRPSCAECSACLSARIPKRNMRFFVPIWTVDMPTVVWRIWTFSSSPR